MLQFKDTCEHTSILVASPPFTIGTVLPAWIRYWPMEWPFRLRTGLTTRTRTVNVCIYATHRSAEVLINSCSECSPFIPWYVLPSNSTSYDSITSCMDSPTSQRRTSMPAHWENAQLVLRSAFTWSVTAIQSLFNAYCRDTRLWSHVQYRLQSVNQLITKNNSCVRTGKCTTCL